VDRLCVALNVLNALDDLVLEDALAILYLVDALRHFSLLGRGCVTLLPRHYHQLGFNVSFLLLVQIR
jgi:hypothetical protein